MSTKLNYFGKIRYRQTLTYAINEIQLHQSREKIVNVQEDPALKKSFLSILSYHF